MIIFIHRRITLLKRGTILAILRSPDNIPILKKVLKICVNDLAVNVITNLIIPGSKSS